METYRSKKARAHIFLSSDCVENVLIRKQIKLIMLESAWVFHLPVFLCHFQEKY